MIGWLDFFFFCLFFGGVGGGGVGEVVFLKQPGHFLND